ncbi:MAG: DHH family phosphoesterase, partial [Bacteroidales bacterium]
MEKRWVLKQYGDRSLVEKLAKELQVGKTSSCPEDLEAYKIIANLLVQRGINNYDDAKSFFRPKLEDLHNPFIMNDMDIAVERVMSAIEKEEKILVYGDYDVDGTSAVALVYSYLREIYNGVDFYIPDRYGEGYGVSYKAINWAIEEDFKLIISLDCGIKAIEQVAYSSSKGIDFIIADHHLPDEELPKACAVLNPKRIDTTYPYRELSGCGVGFKLIHALNIKLGKPFEDIIPYLDLVAIAIAADVVPITGENRILAYYGLKVINQKPRPGLEAILKYADILHLKDKLKNKLYFKREL